MAGELPTHIEAATVDDYATTQQEGVTQSLQAALSQGFHVGVSNGEGMAIKDPRNFATDDAAAQACVDWLEANTNGGTLHIPERRPDGTRTTIANTVATDSSSSIPVGLHIHSAEGQGGTAVACQTTIDNGDPAFHLQGDVGNFKMRSEVRIEAFDCNGNNNEAIKLGDEWSGRVWFGMIVDVGSVGIHFRNDVNEAMVRGGAIRTQGTGNTTQQGILMDASSTTEAGSDISIWANVGDDFRDCVRIKDGFKRCHLAGGHYEGGDATNGDGATVRITGGTSHIHPSCKIGGAKNGAHGALVDGGGTGGPFNIDPGLCSNIDGDGIRQASNPTKGRFGVNTSFLLVSGDDISINNDNDPGDVPTVVPYETTLDGTVTYPSPARSATYYPDGRRLLREGTASISAGSSSEVNNFAGQVGDAPDAHVWIDSDPGAVAGIDWQWTWDTNNAQHNLRVTETEGNTSVSVGYRVTATDF